MSHYRADITVYAQNAEELADMLERAAHRIRNQEYDAEEHGQTGQPSQVPTPAVSGEGSNGGYRYLITATSGEADHFQQTGWTNDNENGPDDD